MIVTFFMRYFHNCEAGFDRNNPFHKRVDPTMETRMLEPHVIQQALVWMVVGARKYYRAGKSVGAVPAEVLQALEAYVQEEVKVGSFVDEYCELGPQATHRVWQSVFVDVYNCETGSAVQPRHPSF
jgi:phage/plasmid-associated DNA primase